MLRLTILTGVIASFQVPAHAECTMTPPRMDINRIAHNPAIKSYAVDRNKLSLTALLKNGHAIRLVHSGCEHSGAEASLWLDSDRPFSDHDGWSNEAITLIRIAFSSDIANAILKSIKSGVFDKKISESRIVFSAAPSSFMSYAIVISRAEQGVLLTVSYVLG